MMRGPVPKGIGLWFTLASLHTKDLREYQFIAFKKIITHLIVTLRN